MQQLQRFWHRSPRSESCIGHVCHRDLPLRHSSASRWSFALQSQISGVFSTVARPTCILARQYVQTDHHKNAACHRESGTGHTAVMHDPGWACLKTPGEDPARPLWCPCPSPRTTTEVTGGPANRGFISKSKWRTARIPRLLLLQRMFAFQRQTSMSWRVPFKASPALAAVKVTCKPLPSRCRHRTRPCLRCLERRDRDSLTRYGPVLS